MKSKISALLNVLYKYRCILGWLLKGFLKGVKNAKIVVLKHLEWKFFFVALPWRAAFKQAVIDLKNIRIYNFPLFRPLRFLYFFVIILILITMMTPKKLSFSFSQQLVCYSYLECDGRNSSSLTLVMCGNLNCSLKTLRLEVQQKRIMCVRHCDRTVKFSLPRYLQIKTRKLCPQSQILLKDHGCNNNFFLVYLIIIILLRCPFHLEWVARLHFSEFHSPFNSVCMIYLCQLLVFAIIIYRICLCLGLPHPQYPSNVSAVMSLIQPSFLAT